jgi:hypothetical protein
VPRQQVLTIVGFIVTGLLAAAAPAVAQGNRCADEAASIRRAEAQLPKLDVAPPGDKQIVCITLETNILFARRLATHVTHCPRSPLARSGDEWARTSADYTERFRDRRCKQAIRAFRG